MTEKTIEILIGGVWRTERVAAGSELRIRLGERPYKIVISKQGGALLVADNKPNPTEWVQRQNTTKP